MSDFIQKLRKLREHIWTNEPQEIKDVLNNKKGYTDTWGSSFFPTLYAWEETVAARNSFLTLRRTLLQSDADLEILKALTKNFIEVYISYLYMTNLQDTTALLREAAEEVLKLSSKAELQDLLEELVRYSGRIHYWIEPLMPWGKIIEAFEAAHR